MDVVMVGIPRAALESGEAVYLKLAPDNTVEVSYRPEVRYIVDLGKDGGTFGPMNSQGLPIVG